MKVIDKDNLFDFLIDKNVNVFIGSSSFEKRCFAVANNLGEAHFERSIIYRVTDLDRRILDNSRIFSMKISSDKTDLVDLSINDPVISFRNILSSLDGLFIGDEKRIAIDITTFTHEGLLMFLKVLYDKKRVGDEIFLCYNCADKYSKNEEIKEEKWLTKGIKQVRSIIGYPGFTDPSSANHLMILFGFERDRTIRLINEFESAEVSLAFGNKENVGNSVHQEMNEERHKQILELFSNSNLFTISLTDPIVTKGEILDYVAKHEEQNIVIAPMNNKISTIGAGLAAIENPNIQLSYLQPNRYNLEGYSEAGDSFFICDMSDFS